MLPAERGSCCLSDGEIMRKHHFIKGDTRLTSCSPRADPQRPQTLASGSNNHFLRLKTSPLRLPPPTFGLRLLLLLWQTRCILGKYCRLRSQREQLVLQSEARGCCCRSQNTQYLQKKKAFQTFKSSSSNIDKLVIICGNVQCVCVCVCVEAVC